MQDQQNLQELKFCSPKVTNIPGVNPFKFINASSRPKSFILERYLLDLLRETLLLFQSKLFVSSSIPLILIRSSALLSLISSIVQKPSATNN